MQLRLLFAACAVSVASAYVMSPKLVINTPPLPTSLTLTTQAPSVTPQNQMRVEGLAEISVQPDRLDFMLTLAAENTRADRAVSDVRKRQNALLESIKSLSLAPEDLTLGLVDLAPQYDYDELGKAHRRGYRASISMVISLKDFERIGEVMQYAADSGAESMHTRFRSTDLKTRKAELREMALKAAKAKAEQTAAAVGATLGEVISIEENPANPAYWYRSDLEVANVYKEVQSPSVPLRAEAQELSLSVYVTYRLGK